jgi:hypothetical protein
MVADAPQDPQAIGAALAEMLSEALAGGDANMAWLLGGGEPRWVELYLRSRGLGYYADGWLEMRERVCAPFVGPDQALASKLLRAVQAVGGLAGAAAEISYIGTRSLDNLADHIGTR